MMTSPRAFPETVSLQEFEIFIQEHFGGKSPSPAPNLLATAGPPGSGKSFYLHTLKKEPDYQNHVLFDGNEEILCQMACYQADLSAGMPLPTAWKKHVSAASIIEGILILAATGASDEKIAEFYTLSDSQLNLLRAHIEPGQYNILLSSTLRDGFECDAIWDKVNRQGYHRTLCVFFGKFSDCQERAKPENRGGWITDQTKKAMIKFNVPAEIPERASYHQDCIDVAKQRIARMTLIESVQVFALMDSSPTPELIAEKKPRRILHILNPGTWHSFPSRSKRTARFSSPIGPENAL